MPTSDSAAGAGKPIQSKAWRNFGRALIGLALVVTGVVLFYLEEDWRGKSDWNAYRRDAQARGVEFDYGKFTPSTVADDQNFAMTPFLAPVLDLNPRPFNGRTFKDQTGLDRAMNFASDFKKAFDLCRANGTLSGEGKLLDLVAFAMALEKQTKSPAQISADSTRAQAAVAVLKNMDSLKPVLDEIRIASRRPQARFNIHYEDEDPAGILLPHLAILKKLAEVLTIRASAELALGQTDAAFENLELVFYLADSVREEPILVSHLVRLAILKYAQQTIWEGLAAHQWSDEQLRELQTRLEKPALIRELKRGLVCERAAVGTKMFDLMRERAGYIRDITEYRTADGAALAWVPAGWLYLEQISYHRYFDDRLLPAFQAEAIWLNPQIIEAADLNFTNSGVFQFSTALIATGQSPKKPALPVESATQRLLHHTVLEHVLANALLPIFVKSALGQTGIDEANVACALERFRLASHKLPETLDPLIPKFLNHLPIDVCNGKPLIYHTKEGGAFLLYSVGWNGTDDGGSVISDETKTPPIPLPKEGDWVWPEYPGN